MESNEKDNSVNHKRNLKIIFLITFICLTIFFIFLMFLKTVLPIPQMHNEQEETAAVEAVKNPQTETKQDISKNETETEAETESSSAQNDEIETNLPEMLEITEIEYDDLKKEIDRFSSMSYNSEAEKEKAFKKVLEAFEAVENKLNDSGIVTNDLLPKNVEKQLNKKFNKLGYEIAMKEGQYYLRIYQPYLMNFSGIPNAWKEYFEITNVEQNHYEDGAMFANEQAIAVLIKYDDFIKKYPEFVEIDNVKDNFDSYLFQFLHGWDNSFVLHVGEDGKMKPEYRTAIQKLIDNYPNFSKHELVKEYYEKLEANEFVLCEDKYCEKKKFGDWLWERLQNEKK